MASNQSQYSTRLYLYNYRNVEIHVFVEPVGQDFRMPPNSEFELVIVYTSFDEPLVRFTISNDSDGKVYYKVWTIGSVQVFYQKLQIYPYNKNPNWPYEYFQTSDSWEMKTEEMQESPSSAHLEIINRQNVSVDFFIEPDGMSFEMRTYYTFDIIYNSGQTRLSDPSINIVEAPDGEVYYNVDTYHLNMVLFEGLEIYPSNKHPNFWQHI